MDIVYHLRSFPKLSESFVLNEIHALTRRDHRIAVFAFNDPGDDFVHSEFNSLDVPIQYATPPPLTSMKGCAEQLFSTPSFSKRLPRNPKLAFRDLSFSRQLLSFIEDLHWEPAVIHGHFASGMRTSARLAADTLGIEQTITAHANDIFSRENRATAHRVLSDADRVITVCQSNKRFIRSKLNVQTPIDVVPASIRFEKFNPTSQSVEGRVLTIARLTEKKGITYAVDSFTDLCERYPHVTYHVIGSGELHASLATRIQNDGLDDHILLLGAVSEDRLLRELNEAQAFLLPSVITASGDRDATPVVLKEAMAMATPCVSTDVGGIPEVIDDGDNGFIVPARDVEALASAVERLLSDDDLRERLGRNARRKARLFDVSRTIERLEASFQTVTAEVHGTPAAQ